MRQYTPTAATLTTFFNQLHQLYPNAKLVFGEIVSQNAVGSNLAAAQSLLSLLLRLKINVPGYIGGYSGGIIMKICCLFI